MFRNLVILTFSFLIACSIVVDESFGTRCDVFEDGCNTGAYGLNLICKRDWLTTDDTYTNTAGEGLEVLTPLTSATDECGHVEVLTGTIWFPTLYQCGGLVPQYDCG